MHYTTLSASAFEAKAKSAVESQPIRKVVSLSELTVISDSILEINSTQIPMSNSAFRDIIKHIGLPYGFDKSFSNTFGPTARRELINRLKSALASKQNLKVTLIVSPTLRQVVSVIKGTNSPISAQTFIKTATDIIDKHSLQVNSFSVSESGGAYISTTNPNSQWGIKGLRDEDFYGGVSFSNDPNQGFQISPYLERLICANGMIGKSFEETIAVKGFSAFDFQVLNKELERMAKSGFKPATFEAKVRSAIETRASYSELQSAHELMVRASGAEDIDIESWAPLKETSSAFYRFGIDPEVMTQEQKKTAKTGTSIWELVNGLTHFSTHDNGFEINQYERSTLQVAAGKLMVKKFDMDNLVRSPF